MKKKFVSLALCMALLSSFTVSASASFSSTDSDHLTDIWRQLTGVSSYAGIYDWVKNLNTNVTTLKNAFSDTRQSVNPIAYYAQQIYNKMGDSSSNDYSTTLANIYKNTSSIDSALDAISGDTHSISAAIPSITQYLSNINSSIGTAQIAITNHIDSASAQNHTDLTSFAAQNHTDFNFLFDSVFDPVPSGLSSSQSGSYRYPIFLNPDDTVYYGSFGNFILFALNNLTNDRASFAGGPTLFHIVHQLQQVLASDDDLALKNDNKANEDAATDAFVNGSSSKTSLGTGDIGNLKDVGGTFNDLTSLNGQSSVTSFLNGLSSADGTGQGWFSEATRASLDAVSTPVTTTNLVRKTWRGEKSLTYSISADTSVNVVASPAPARAPAADPDPYNMSGFEDNYNWLWGDAS